MLVQSVRKQRYLRSVWLVLILVGIGGLVRVAPGQEKCEDAKLKHVETPDSDMGDIRVEDSERDSRSDFDRRKSSFSKEEQEKSEIKPLDDLSTTSPRQNSESLQNSAQRPLDQIGLSLQAELPIPELKRPPNTPNAQTQTALKRYEWTAPNDFYENLLFEEPLLERHGISTHPRLQRHISGLKFLKDGVLLPLHLIKGNHRRCDNPLGWGVPGDKCR